MSCRGWKDLVDEWVKSAGDVAAAAMAGKVNSFDLRSYLPSDLKLEVFLMFHFLSPVF